MDVTKLINDNLPSIKKLLFNEEVQEVEAAQAKLADGTILNIEPALEVGAKADVMDEAGELTPAPDGQHELEDGTLITIEGGLIVEVQAVEAPAEEEMSADVDGEPVPEAPVALDIEKLQEQLIQKLNVAITEKIEKLRFAKIEEVESLKAENKTLREACEKMVELVEKFSETPKEEPKKKVANPFSSNGNSFFM